MEEKDKPKLKFVTKTEISKETVAKANWRALPSSMAFKVYAAGCAIFAFVLILGASGRNYGLVIMAIIALCVFSILIYVRVKAEADLGMKRIREMYGPDTFFVESGFADDAVYVTNERTQQTHIIPYEQLAYLNDTKDCIYLVTEARRTVTVNKFSLSEDEQKKLMAFLWQKGIGKKNAINKMR